MKDEKLLEKLNMLNSLSGKEAEDYLRLFIEDVRMDIAKECDDTIGFGSSGKLLTKLIKAKRKKDILTAGLLASSKKGVFVLTGADYVLSMTGGSAGLPVRYGLESLADTMLEILDTADKNCTEYVTLPTRAMVDFEKKDYDASSEEDKDPIRGYDLGSGLPIIKFETLSDILGIVQPHNGFADPRYGKKSALYLKHYVFRCVMFPVGTDVPL